MVEADFWEILIYIFMQHAYRKFLFPLKTGTRLLVLIFTLLYVTAFIGAVTKSFDLVDWLGLRSTSVWHGELWRVVTYAFLAPTLLVFVINGILLITLCAFLERVWSSKELWLYCFISAAGAGLAKVLVTPSDPVLMVASVSLIFGLLVAWARLYGHEQVWFMGLWEMNVRTAAWVFGIVNVIIIFPCAGFVNTLILLCGGVAGWLYLVLRVRTVLAQQSQTVGSVRMGRLEL